MNKHVTKQFFVWYPIPGTRYHFQSLSGILSPELETLSDDGAASHRLQERMTRHRRGNTSRLNNPTTRKTGVVPAFRVGSIMPRVKTTDKVTAT